MLNLFSFVFICFPTDIDECANENAECNHLCINEYGSYHCQCRDGYTLALDAHSCFGKAITNLYFNLITVVIPTCTCSKLFVIIVIYKRTHMYMHAHTRTYVHARTYTNTHLLHMHACHHYCIAYTPTSCLTSAFT